MDTNSKLERLLEILEHPDRFSEEEIRQALEDPTCREYYKLIAETREALAYGEGVDALSDIDVDKEWDSFKAGQDRKTRHIWRKAVAVGIVGLLFMSVVSVAAIRMVTHFNQSDKGQPTAVVDDDTNTAAPMEEAAQDSVSQIVFDNVELQYIMNDLEERFGINVVYKSDKMKSLRLYLQLDSAMSIDEVILIMNHFENLTLSRRENTVTVN